MHVWELLNGVRYGKYDKTVHFFLSLLLTLAVAALMPVWVAAGVAFAVGVGKEWYDASVRRGRFDIADLGVNLLGICAAVVVQIVWGNP